jgi:hypothetical protein
MATINSPQKGNETNVILVLFLTIIMLLTLCLTSCKSPEKVMDKAYKTVSTDLAPATEKRKAQLAGWVAANFPIQEKIIEKVLVEKVIDTSEYDFFRKYIASLNKQLSINNCPTIDTDSVIELAKKTFKPDTVKIKTQLEKTVKDTTGNWLRHQKEIELIGVIGKLNNEKEKLKSELQYTENKSAKKDKWLWYFIISVVVLISSHYFRTKIKIPF